MVETSLFTFFPCCSNQQSIYPEISPAHIFDLFVASQRGNYVLLIAKYPPGFCPYMDSVGPKYSKDLDRGHSSKHQDDR